MQCIWLRMNSAAEPAKEVKTRLENHRNSKKVLHDVRV